MAELLERVGSAELTEWMAFAAIEPFGGPIDDLRAGLAPAATFSVNTRDGAKPPGPLDFYSWHRPEEARSAPPADSPEVVAARIKREIFGVREP